MKETPPYEAVGKITSLINCFIDESSSWGVRELAAHLGLPKSTVHRLLSALTMVDWLKYDESLKRYTLGFELYRMTMVLSQNMPVIEVARPYLHRISEETGESVMLCWYNPSERKVVFLDIVESIHPLRYEVRLGTPRELYAGATCRSIMAFLPAEVQREVIDAGLEAVTQKTLINPAELEQKLEETRTKGYAVSAGERIPGAISVAAPFWDSKGVLGSLALTVPEQRVASDDVIETWAQLLVSQANDLSARLGGHYSERRRANETKSL